MYSDVFVETALSWLGAKEGDTRHKEIIDTYNAHKPLARGYALSYSDPWCAAFVSFVSIKCGYTSIIPTECSCSKLIEKFKAIKCYFEDESRTPAPGDVIFYDWEDDGSGDNKGTPNHVGIVAVVNDGKISVVEGNKDNAVAIRNIPVDGQYIRGYAVPAFDDKNIPFGEVKLYTIQKGDTLSKIAKQFATTVGEIQSLNRSKLVDPNKIRVGDTLIIPNPEASETEKASETKERDFEEIGRRFCEFMEDVKTLETYEALMRWL